jgi:hypothetical protein
MPWISQVSWIIEIIMAMKKALPIMLILIFSFFLSACDDADYELAVDLLIDWSHEKGLVVCIDPNADPATCEVETSPGFNTWLGGQVADNVADSTGSSVLGAIVEGASDAYVSLTSDEDEPKKLPEGTEAMLDTGVVYKDIAEADALAAEALKNGDPSKYQEAIKKRPNDWAYQEQYWAFYAAQRDEEKMYEISEESDELVLTQIKATFAAKDYDGSEPEALNVCRNTFLSQYRHREKALIDQYERDVNNPHSDFLEAQIRLVRSKVDQVLNDDPKSPCNKLFPN